MEGVGWIGTIIIGGLAGWVAEKVMRSDMGLLMNIILGIVGALVLNAILYAVDVIPPGGWLWQFIIALIGASILIAIFRMFRGRSIR
jgi:uncharacterized membrane protein YeaQ/YmgE (transglycosylase-associated protein family)